ENLSLQRPRSKSQVGEGLLSKPKLVLMDESTSGLDAANPIRLPPKGRTVPRSIGVLSPLIPTLKAMICQSYNYCSCILQR
ncbi:hypothetical protein CFOL_v3_19462, partial [Cephalotus follicularis]